MRPATAYRPSAGGLRRGIGINSRQDLAVAEAVLKGRKLDEVMSSGVTVISPETTFMDFDVVVGQDTVIHPYTILTGRTVVGRRCELGPHTTLLSAVVDDDSDVCHSYARECHIGPQCKVGPYAYIRPGTELRQGAKALVRGDKELRDRRGLHAPHLPTSGTRTWLRREHRVRTVVCNTTGSEVQDDDEDDAFVGSNTNLRHRSRWAWVQRDRLHDNRGCAEGALAVARARQENKEGWAERKRRLAKADKDN